jgi:hypothetical protein
MKYIRDKDGDLYRQDESQELWYYYDPDGKFWEYEGMLVNYVYKDEEPIGWVLETIKEEFGPIEEITEQEVFLEIL